MSDGIAYSAHRKTQEFRAWNAAYQRAHRAAKRHEPRVTGGYVPTPELDESRYDRYREMLRFDPEEVL